MKIALVNQPIGTVRPIGPEEPFSGGSITLWNYHMARELADGHDPRVLTRGAGAPGAQEIHGSSFWFVDTGDDEARAGRAKRRQKLFGMAGWRPDPRRPFFASEEYFRTYAEGVAAHVRESDCDVVSITNYSQLVPIIRRRNPDVGIHLHMQCEWLNQFDADLIRPRLDACDYVSGCSQFIVDQACAAYPGIGGRSFALLNGVDTETFRPDEAQKGTNVEDGDLEIVYVGRISPEKGIHFLLEAFNEIVEQVPQARLTLIGGRSPAPYEYIVAIDPDQRVKAMAEFYTRRRSTYLAHLDRLPSARASARLRYMDDMPQKSLLDAYRRAAVFVFPSAWNEPFGMPVIEAMACATPVVSTYSGGIPEFVEDGKTGRLVERATTAPLRDALLELLGDSEMRRRLGHAGRRHVAAEMSWADVARRYLSVMGGRANAAGTYLVNDPVSGGSA